MMRYLAGDERKAESSLWGGSETVDFSRYKFHSPSSEKYKGQKKASECYKIPFEKMKEDLVTDGLKREGTFTISKDGGDTTPKGKVRFIDDNSDVIKTCAQDLPTGLPDKIRLDNQANINVPRTRSYSDPVGKIKKGQKKVTFDNVPKFEDIKERSKSTGSEIDIKTAQKQSDGSHSSRIPRLISNTNVKASSILQKIVENTNMFDLRNDDVFEAEPTANYESPKVSRKSPREDRQDPVVLSVDTWVREEGVGECAHTVSRSNKKGQGQGKKTDEHSDNLVPIHVEINKKRLAKKEKSEVYEEFPIRTEPEGGSASKVVGKRRHARRRMASESETPVAKENNDNLFLGNVTVPFPTNRGRQFTTPDNHSVLPEYVITARTYTLLDESDDNSSGSDPKLFPSQKLIDSRYSEKERNKPNILLNRKQRRVLRLPALPNLIRERDLNDDLSLRIRNELPGVNNQNDSGIESPPSDDERCTQKKLIRENSNDVPFNIREVMREKAKSRLKELRFDTK